MLSERKKIRLMDTYRNLFYTPLYVAEAEGFLSDQGLDVVFGTVPEKASATQMLRSGDVDIVQSGISRSLMDLDEGREDAPIHIAEINQRDGFFLLSRQPVEEWEWKGLEGSTLIPIGFTPVPWNPLRTVLLNHEVEISSIKLVKGITAIDAIDLFKEGKADYLHIPHPYAQSLIDEGFGHLVASLGPELGYICYSSFAVAPYFIDENSDTVQAFVNGFQRSLEWVDRNDAFVIAEKISSFFPHYAMDTLERGIGQYKSQKTWPQNTLIGEDGYIAMRDILIEGGLVNGSYSYERLVRPEFAHKAISG